MDTQPHSLTHLLSQHNTAQHSTTHHITSHHITSHHTTSHSHTYRRCWWWWHGMHVCGAEHELACQQLHTAIISSCTPAAAKELHVLPIFIPVHRDQKVKALKNLHDLSDVLIYGRQGNERSRICVHPCTRTSALMSITSINQSINQSISQSTNQWKA